MSGSGRGASGRSSSSRPSSARSGTQLGPEPVDHLGQPGQPGPVLHVGDRGRAERGQVAQHQPVRRGIGGERPARARSAARPCRARPLRPQTPRGGSCTIGTSARAVCASAISGRVRPALAQQPAQLAEGQRLLGDQRAGQPRPARPGRPRSAGVPKLDARPSAPAPGCSTGRSAAQSAALTRWMVERCSAIRTASPLATAAASSAGSKPAIRSRAPTYGSAGSCACSPTRCVDDLQRRPVDPVEEELTAQQGTVQGTVRDHDPTLGTSAAGSWPQGTATVRGSATKRHRVNVSGPW